MSERVAIYTDGACSGNPGPGGWGALLRLGERERELCGGEAVTTNNRMELMAAIMALEALKRPCAVDLYTDSQYLRQGITAWISNWKRRRWRTATGSPVKNEDLWRRLDEARRQHQVVWHWVRGHAGHVENERVDALARKGLSEARNAQAPAGKAAAKPPPAGKAGAKGTPKPPPPAPKPQGPSPALPPKPAKDFLPGETEAERAQRHGRAMQSWRAKVKNIRARSNRAT